MKKSVYLDTTIPSYLFDQRESIKLDCERTKQWWSEESQKYDIYVSQETVTEVQRGNYSHKTEAIDFVDKIQRLEEHKEIYEVVDFYIFHKLVPQSVSGDALHLAYASFYKLDFLLTWNCNHLANANKQQHIHIINGRLGLHSPLIITPLELFTEKEE